MFRIIPPLVRQVAEFFLCHVEHEYKARIVFSVIHCDDRVSDATVLDFENSRRKMVVLLR